MIKKFITKNYGNSISNILKGNRIKTFLLGGFIEISNYEPIKVNIIPHTKLYLNNDETLDYEVPTEYIPDYILLPKNLIFSPELPLYNLKDKPEKISLLLLLKEEGFKFRITSGYRKGAKTKQGRYSNHGKKDKDGNPEAYDIVPIDGNFSKFKKELYSNPRVVKWLLDRNWGILEETTSKIMLKTGATGKHFHFGPDIAALNMSRNNGVSYAAFGMKFQNNDLIQTSSFGSSDFNMDYPDLPRSLELPSIEIAPNQNGIVNSYLLSVHDMKNSLNTSTPVSTTVSTTASPKPDEVLNTLSLEGTKLLLKLDSKYANNSNYNKVKNTISKLISDPIKLVVLLKIAENESTFNPNATSPASTASGLFGFLNSTKKLYGYGLTIKDLVLGASKLYDDIYNRLQKHIKKYGTRNKSLMQLIYGMWFRPASLIKFLTTGLDSYKDSQGSGLNTIFKKML